jgi:hypothetical protein
MSVRFLFFFNNFFLFYSKEFKVTSVDHIKEKAVTDAYMRMYKLLFQSGKVPAFIFHKNREIPGKTFNFGNSSNYAKSTTDTFCN